MKNTSAAVQRLTKELAASGPCRQGSLCADKKAGGWIHSKKSKGKTVSMRVAQGREERIVRAQIERHRRFRALVRELEKIFEREADRQLEAARRGE